MLISPQKDGWRSQSHAFLAKKATGSTSKTSHEGASVCSWSFHLYHSLSHVLPKQVACHAHCIQIIELLLHVCWCNFPL